MTGHLRQRSPGTWQLVLFEGLDAAGRKKYSYRTVRGTKREAQAELTRLLHQKNTGEYVGPSKLTVAEYLQRWLRDYAEVKCSAKTALEYRKLVEGHLAPRIGKLALVKLGPQEVQRLYGELRRNGRKDGMGGLSGRTCQAVHACLHTALACAVRWQVLVRNVCDAVDHPAKEEKSMGALDVEQTVVLLERLKHNALYPIVLAAVSTGLRRAELLGLEWDDINLTARTLTVKRAMQQIPGKVTAKEPKSKTSRRTVSLPPLLVEELVRHRGRQAEAKLTLGADGYADHGLVFCRDDGLPLTPNALTCRFAEFMKKHPDLPKITFHGLRHGHASQLLAAGASLKDISNRLGHSGISITANLYTHLFDPTGQEMADKLDAALRQAMEGR